MNDEHDMQEPDDFDVVNFEGYGEDELAETDELAEEEVYEEIDPAEIDSIVSALNDMIENVKSQTIRDYLEATCSDIACLMEEFEDEEEGDLGLEAA